MVGKTLGYLYKKLQLKFEGLFKGALSGLRHFLENENPLKVMKNTLYFTVKAFFLHFGHVEKRLD